MLFCCCFFFQLNQFRSAPVFQLRWWRRRYSAFKQRPHCNFYTIFQQGCTCQSAVGGYLRMERKLVVCYNIQATRKKKERRKKRNRKWFWLQGCAAARLHDYKSESKNCDVQWGGQGLIIAAGAKAAPPRKISLFRPPDGSKASRQSLCVCMEKKRRKAGRENRSVPESLSAYSEK